MPKQTQKRLGEAFNEQATRIGLLLAFGATALFCVVAHYSLGAQADASIRRQAHICAAAIDPAPGGDIYPSFRRLRSKFPGLVAAATLSSRGRIESLMPDIDPYRELARLAAEQAGTPVRHDAGAMFGTGVLWGVSTSLAPDDDPTARRVVIILADRGAYTSWTTAAIVFGVGMIVAVLLFVRALRHWFQQQVLAPLQSIATSVIIDPAKRHRARPLRTLGWREFELIVDRVHGLRRELVESDGRRRRAEHVAERRLEEEQVGANRKLQRERKRALTDPLTGLYNRAFLEERLETIFQEHRSSGRDLTFAMLDLDNFKPHNDTHGHAAGDEALRFVGRLLAGAIRPTDFAVRYGGDEFLLILAGADAAQARAVAKRIAILFAQYAATVGNGQGLAISVGVASLSETGCGNGHALLACADRALYGVKRTGKNGVGVHRAATTAAPWPADHKAVFPTV